MTDPLPIRSGVGLAVFLMALGALAAGLAMIAPAPAKADTVDKIEVEQVTKTTALVTITLSEGSSASQVYVHYRTTTPQGPWSEKDPVTVIGPIARYDLPGLTPGTEYEVEASLDKAFPPTGSVSEKFTTLPPDPYVSAVSAKSDAPTEATVTITIDHPGETPNTVYVRYRTNDSQPWSDPLISETSATGKAQVTLSGLTPGTGYEVQASLEKGFVAEQTESTSFKTLLPRVSKVDVQSKTSSGANVKVTIEDAGPDANTVYLRYGVSSSETTWAAAPDKSVTGAAASFVLTGLVPGTPYTVQASLDRNFVSGVVASSFTTVRLPSLGPVNVGSVGETTATLAVTIFDPDGTKVEVFMRYRETPDGAWSKTQSGGSSTDTLEFALSGLKPGTEYKAEVSRSSGFEAPSSVTFTTEKRVTRISSIAHGKLTRSSVEISVEIDNAQGATTVYFRYQVVGSGVWISAKSVNASSGAARLTLRNLKPDTLYEVEASLVSEFTEVLYVDFTTEPGAELTAIRIENVTDTAANVIATIDRVEGRTVVYLRYRTYDAQEWSGPVTTTTTSARASLELTELLPDTEYEIEASLDMSFPPPKTKSKTFKTNPSPSISSLSVRDITDTGAKVSVNISRPQPRMTVYLRHRIEGSEGWSRVASKATSSRSVSLLLEGLIPETRYEVQASLNADFGEQKGTFFTTEEKGPSISGLTSEEITTDGVTIVVSIADPRDRMTVYLRTRETGSARWGAPTSRTTSDSRVSFKLSDLASNTTYDVEVSLQRSFPAQDRARATFTTRSVPRVSEVVIREVMETRVLAVIRSNGIQEADATVYIRHRELPEGAWIENRIRVEEADSPVLIPGLSPDTEYEVQASLDAAFGDAFTLVQRFRTPAPEPEIGPTPTPEIPVVSATPREVSFTMTEDALVSRERRLSIWSSGPMTGVEVNINQDVEWLYVDPASGTSMNPEDILIVELKVDASGLGVGTYSGELELNGNAENLPLRIPVTLTIGASTSTQAPTPIPELMPSPTETPPLPLASPSPLPNPEPTQTAVPTPTIVPAPAETPYAESPPQATSFSLPTSISLPTSAPTSPADARDGNALLAATIFLVVSSIVFLIVVALLVRRWFLRP